MKILKTELSAVAVRENQYPQENLPEIALAGRSNVGKSSLLNYLVNRRKMARVSGNPGKTRTINFFDINDQFRIVDLPGYGYAKVSKSQSQNWGDMIEYYLENRSNLLKVIQLIDIRHAPSKQDIQMYDYLKYHDLDGLVVATKSDKVKRNELNKNINMIRQTLDMKKDDILIPISSLKRTGAEDLWDTIEVLLNESNK